MYLNNIVVRNFRNLEFLEVELSQGLNVIVGENNIGKTNLLDAIRAGLGSASSSTNPIRLWKEDIYVGPDCKAANEPIRVDLTFAGLSDEEQAEFLEVLNYDTENPERSTASIHFEWSWNEKTNRWHSRRWGGERSNSESPLPGDLLQSVPITLLEALRDAVSALVPGRQSRLGRLLKVTANDCDKTQLQEIIEEANEQLQKNNLIKGAEEKICLALKGASGQFLGQEVNIRASEPEFDRIVRNLRLVLNLSDPTQTTKGQFIQELKNNGLGYNNLIYIATVLAELEALSDDAALPLLLVEEPEAHLHPQLQILLSDFLAKGGAKDDSHRMVQTIVTTHSPTIAAHVPTKTIRVLHREPTGMLRCVGLERCGLTSREADQLRRMFDVTKATLLFARGIILVEGITEALILPVLAQRLGIRLEDRAVSVIPICGVDFSTIPKIFGEDKLKIPVAIVTDGDPEAIIPEEADKNWRNESPKKDDSGYFEVCARVLKLKKSLAQNGVVGVFPSKVTLEYDLAYAGSNNADIMCDAWEKCFQGGTGPRTFNQRLLKECGGDLEARALVVWRGICRANATRSKSEFAQKLVEILEEKDGSGNHKIPDDEFVIPDYIIASIKHVTK